MDVILPNIIQVTIAALNIYQWIIIINVVISWLVAFNVINTSNQFVYMVMDFTYRLTEPLYRRIRAILPNMGNVDLSPVVVILGLMLIKGILGDLYYKL